MEVKRFTCTLLDPQPYGGLLIPAWLFQARVNGRQKGAIALVIPEDRLPGGDPTKVVGLPAVVEARRENGVWRAVEFVSLAPETEDELRRLLATVTRGVGAKTASKIVKAYGMDLIPAALNGTDALGRLQDAIKEGLLTADPLVAKLIAMGLTSHLAKLAARELGIAAVRKLKENPYVLCSIKGIGFKRADEIALMLGVEEDALERVEAAVQYVLMEALNTDGHCWVSEDTLREKLVELDVPVGKLKEAFTDLEKKRTIVREGDLVAFAYVDRAEREAREVVIHLANRVFIDPPPDVSAVRSKVEAELGLVFTQEQVNAVQNLFRMRLSILAGLPGTGKTTTLRLFIAVCRELGLKVALASPTGKAAERLSQATGVKAITLHRLLEYAPTDSAKAAVDGGQLALFGESYKADGSEERKVKWGFRRNEFNPIKADVVVVDEASMVDLFLFRVLLRAIGPRTALVLVGDPYQLPPVGPGQPFKDLIENDYCSKVVFTHVHRQAQDSGVVQTVHRVFRGDPKSVRQGFGLFADVHFLGVSGEGRVAVSETFRKTIAAYRRLLELYPSTEVQILSPMKKGMLGTKALGKEARKHALPKMEFQARELKAEVLTRLGELSTDRSARFTLLLARGADARSVKTSDLEDYRFYFGDRVIQKENLYGDDPRVGAVILPLTTDAPWAVFNGETGVVIFTGKEGIIIHFGDRLVFYRSPARYVDLAYAITVHKAQGSEYEAVVIPISFQHYVMLNRQLVYTAFSRAKSTLVVVGDEKALAYAVRNNKTVERMTFL